MVRVTLSLVLICVMLVSADWNVVDVVARQGSVEVPIESTASSVTVNAPWREAPDLREIEAGREIVVLTGTNDTMLIGYLAADSINGDPIARALGGHAAALGSLTDIDRNTRYALQAAEINGVPYGVFSLVYTNRNPGIVEVHIYIAPASTFATGLSSVQESVRVNGRSVFLRVNGRTLQSLIVRSAGPGDPETDASLAPPLQHIVPVATGAAPTITPTVSIAPTESPVATVAPAPESTSRTPTTQNGATAAPPSDPATPVAVRQRPGTDVSMYTDVGVIEDGHYVSPQFGTDVRWDARWTVLHTEDDSSVTSDWVTRTDSLTLVSTVYPDVTVVISLHSAYDFGMDDWKTALTLRDRQDFPEVFTEIGATSGVVVLRDRAENQVFLFDVSTSEDGSVFHEIELRSSRGAVTSVMEDVTGGITMNDAPVFRQVTMDEVRALFP